MQSQLDFRLSFLHPRLSDWTGVGYRGGENPPVVLGANVIEYGPGIHNLTTLLRPLSGQVVRGAGVNATIMRFPSLLTMLGRGSWFAGGATDAPGWSTGGGAIWAEGKSEVGIEDLTIEFPAHTARPHFYEEGHNAFHLGNCQHSWVRRVRIGNADSGLLCYRLTN